MHKYMVVINGQEVMVQQRGQICPTVSYKYKGRLNDALPCSPFVKIKTALNNLKP